MRMLLLFLIRIKNPAVLSITKAPHMIMRRQNNNQWRNCAGLCVLEMISEAKHELIYSGCHCWLFSLWISLCLSFSQSINWSLSTCVKAQSYLFWNLPFFICLFYVQSTYLHEWCKIIIYIKQRKTVMSLHTDFTRVRSP